MKNKKGFLLGEETVKIVIAVIAIGILAYFLAAVYFSGDDELDEAKGSLNHLISEINAGADVVEIFGPSKDNRWSIVSWPVEGEISERCEDLGFSSCLCFCKFEGQAEGINVENFKRRCDNEGVCKESDYSIGGNFYIGIMENQLPLQLEINHEKKEITNGA